jgi:hypothetical protein
MNTLATWTSDDWVKVLVELTIAVPVIATAIIGIIKANRAQTTADSSQATANNANTVAAVAQNTAESADAKAVRTTDRVIAIAQSIPPAAAAPSAPPAAPQPRVQT